MNTIKAWNPDYKEWLNVDAIFFNPKDENGIIKGPYIFDENNNIHMIKTDEYDGPGYVELVKPTGKKDKYGKELWEGDYIQPMYSKKTFVIKYYPDRACFGICPIDDIDSIPRSMYYNAKWKKVGNKYEGIIINENTKKCDSCNNDAMFKYNGALYCEKCIINKLLEDKKLEAETTYTYFDKNGKYFGEDYNIRFNDLIKHFNIEEL